MMSSLPRTNQNTVANRYRVAIGYTAHCEGELDLNIGDVVGSVKLLGNGWAVGSKQVEGCGYIAGVFPSTCIELLDNSVISETQLPHEYSHHDVIDLNQDGNMSSYSSCDGCQALSYPSISHKCGNAIPGLKDGKPKMIVKPTQDLSPVRQHCQQQQKHQEQQQQQHPQQQTKQQKEQPRQRDIPQQYAHIHRHKEPDVKQRKHATPLQNNEQQILKHLNENQEERIPINKRTTRERKSTHESKSIERVSKERDLANNPSLGVGSSSERALRSFSIDWKNLTSAASQENRFSPSDQLANEINSNKSKCEHLGPLNQPDSEVPDEVCSGDELYGSSEDGPERGSIPDITWCSMSPMRSHLTHSPSLRQYNTLDSALSRSYCTVNPGRCCTEMSPSRGRLPLITPQPPFTMPLIQSTYNNPPKINKSSAMIHPRLRQPSDSKSNNSSNFIAAPELTTARGSGGSKRPPRCESVLITAVGSFAAVLLIGVVIFILAHYQLDYGIWTSLALSTGIGALVGVALVVSRVCRCVLAILLPSICTGKGRVAYSIFMIGCLLGGPVTNIYVNMQEAAESMSCSVERSYNQTMLLLEPFDSMMLHVNSTLSGLQAAAGEVWKGLRPLEMGLGNVESDVYNGYMQLHGTGKTCRMLIERAHNSCTAGILSAREQCIGVIGALGSVYHHARDILDTINPDRWAPKQTAANPERGHDQMDLPEGGGIEDLTLSQGDSDICQPLSSTLVCNSLSNSTALCQPSSWAGDAIQEAINSTRYAMTGLRRALQFTVEPEPYHRSRVKASQAVFQIRRNVNEEFTRFTQHFLFVVQIMIRLVPVSLLILVYSAYRHVALYRSSDVYDNLYIGDHFRRLDRKRCQACEGEPGLLPLRRYEMKYLADVSQWRLSECETRLRHAGLCVFFMLLLTTFFCFVFDFILYWVLSLVGRYGSFGYEVMTRGDDKLGMVVTGEGLIVDLLEIFLKSFQNAHWPSSGSDLKSCLPRASFPSVFTISVVLLLHFTLFLTIIFKARVYRMRNDITGYFYAERNKQRDEQLYKIVQIQRSHLQNRLTKVAILKYSVRRKQLINCRLLRICAGLPLCRNILQRIRNRCLVCKWDDNVKILVHCVTEGCLAIYCKECYSILGDVCPVCVPRDTYTDDVTAYDDDVDDCLLLFSLSSRRYIDC